MKGVGPKVIERLEQMGLFTLSQLADADANDILAQGASLTESSCWKNSPKPRPQFRRQLVPQSPQLTVLDDAPRGYLRVALANSAMAANISAGR